MMHMQFACTSHLTAQYLEVSTDDVSGVFLAGYVRWCRVRLYAELARDH